MHDLFDKPTRRHIMSTIKSKNTQPELRLRRKLHKLGMRYRINYRLKGKPDIVLTKQKIAIFVDGDFWHGWLWKQGIKPASSFWKNKIKTNMRRDKKVNRQLKIEGWKVIRLWEHDVNNKLAECVSIIQSSIRRDI